MSNEKKYSVIELAEQLGAKRTTVNDWLSRYALYIESSVQGKRRIYSENALAVLKKISELRGAGLSSAEIDGELAKLYAVHPQPEMTAQKDEMTETLPQVAEIQKNEATELLRQFHVILEKLENMEQANHALPPPLPPPPPAKKGMGLPLLLLVFVFLAGLLAAVSLYAKQEIETMQTESRKQTEEIRRQSAENAGLKRDVYLLDKSRADFEENVKKLEAAIAREKAAQAEQLKKLEQTLAQERDSRKKQILDLEKLRQTEAELREVKYEKDRLELVRKLEQKLAEAEKLAQEKQKVINEKAAAEKKLAELQKSGQEKIVQPPSPAPAAEKK